MRTRLKYVNVRVASTAGIAASWAANYQHPKDGWRIDPLAGGKTAKAIYDELCALGRSPSPEDVANVIGNKSWSYISCEGCNEYVLKAAAIGEYEAKPYCETCLTEALTALKS